MRLFARLFQQLDATSRTGEKVALLEAYFRAAPPADAAWALHFFCGRKVKRTVSGARLRQWASDLSGLPLWLVEECYDSVGDLAETIALILPAPSSERDWSLAGLVEGKILPLSHLGESGQREMLRALWNSLPADQRFLVHKFLTGGLRVGVSRALVVRAMAAVAGVAAPVMAHRLMGAWSPSAEAWARLLEAERAEDKPALPYPFFLASPLGREPRELGALEDWQVEWKWDGIRAQVIRRACQTVIWSRGEEMLAGAFPEIAGAGSFLPDGTVLDGEIVVWADGRPAPFSSLQRRLGRKKVTAAMLRDWPAMFLAYDLLEWEGQDGRDQPLEVRRRQLQSLVEEVRGAWARRAAAGAARPPRAEQSEMFPQWAPAASAPESGPEFPLRFSGELQAATWSEVGSWQEAARREGTEGLMLKRRDSTYGVGRQRGAWWKWKVDPYAIDAVLVAAQKGHGRRADLFTDYTFALWDGAALVPVARAYSGLTDDEILEVDRFIRRHITERHGPVRSVAPELVFELAFEGIRESGRHKAGLALRFPRMARWRRDKKAREADTLDTLRSLLPS